MLQFLVVIAYTSTFPFKYKSDDHSLPYAYFFCLGIGLSYLVLWRNLWKRSYSNSGKKAIKKTA